ncbi:MAG: response regulator transcription factor [Methylacidiphilales bacterium]|nr:response regulator transcription factor [Candidatus Methylacidiphilales bacterium]
MVVDDEADMLDMLVINLRSAGFEVIQAEDGPTAIAKARSESPYLILLDLLLPQVPGLEVFKELKNEAQTRNIPVIMVTSKAEEVDKIVGLELGADDYVTKPFSPRELVLRINRSLQRVQDEKVFAKKLIAGDLVLDSARHEAFVKNVPVELTATEFRILTLLMERRGEVQGRDDLLNEVWGYENSIYARAVDTHIRRLRKKLGTMGDCIETIPGTGYRLTVDESIAIQDAAAAPPAPAPLLGGLSLVGFWDTPILQPAA